MASYQMAHWHVKEDTIFSLKSDDAIKLIDDGLALECGCRVRPVERYLCDPNDSSKYVVSKWDYGPRPGLMTDSKREWNWVVKVWYHDGVAHFTRFSKSMDYGGTMLVSRSAMGEREDFDGKLCDPGLIEGLKAWLLAEDLKVQAGDR